MAKCRLNLGRTTLKSVSDTIIMCKKIHTINIDGVNLYKSNFITSTEIQNFYRHILKNKEYITYVKYGDEKEEFELFLNNKLQHNYFGPSFIKCKIKDDVKNIEWTQYYIDGLSYSKEEWLVDKKRKQYVREEKLKRLINGKHI